MYRLVALLGKPSIDAYCLTPLLVRKEDEEQLLVYRGHLDTPPTTHSEKEMRLISSQCRMVDELGVAFGEEPLGLVAGWLGARFVQECWRLDLMEPLLPPKAIQCVSSHDPACVDGAFWLGTPESIHARLHAWLITAARVTYRTRSRDIARLMYHCLPESIETQAALWHVADSPKERQESLLSSYKLYKVRERSLNRMELQRRFVETIRASL